MCNKFRNAIHSHSITQSSYDNLSITAIQFKQFHYCKLGMIFKHDDEQKEENDLYDENFLSHIFSLSRG